MAFFEKVFLFRGAESGSIRFRRGVLLWLVLPLAPVIDSRIPALSSNLLPNAPKRFAGYAFTVVPQGLVLASCDGRSSKLVIRPGELESTASGDFRELHVRGDLCTQFGFKSREEKIYVPEELMNPTSDVVQGLWALKTYPGVPSAKSPERTLTVQAKRLSADEMEISWLSPDLGAPEFPPVRVKLGEPDEMETVENWSTGLLPWKAIQFAYDAPALSAPLVIEGKLSYFAFESMQ